MVVWNFLVTAYVCDGDEILLLSELKTTDENFKYINNEDVNEENTKVENNVPAVVNFTESSAAANTLKNYVDQIHYSKNSLKALL